MSDSMKQKAFPIFQVQLYRDEDGNCIEEWEGKKGVKRYHALIPGGLAELQVSSIREAFDAYHEAVSKARGSVIVPPGFLGMSGGEA